VRLLGTRRPSLGGYLPFDTHATIMKPINPRGRGHTKHPPRGLSGTARAARSLLRRQLAGAKRIEAVLKPEAAAALTDLRERSGRTCSAIIEGLLLAEHARELRGVG
jgi:hypothetical protein